MNHPLATREPIPGPHARGTEADPDALDADLEKAKQALDWLSATSIELVSFPPDRDLYEFICRKVKELVGNAIVGVNSIDEEARVLQVRRVAGIGGAMLAKVEALANRKLIGTSFDGVDDEAKVALASGSLTEVEGGVYRMFFRRIPQPVCTAMEKLIGVKSIHSIGLRRNGKLLGNVTIVARRGATLDKNVVETFINEASAALERRLAEAELREERNRLRRLLDMHERDRQLVAYEIHDGFVQPVTAGLMHLENHLRLLDGPGPDRASESGRRAVELLSTSIAEARRLMGGLRPAVLDEFGVVTALETLVEQSGNDGRYEIEFIHDVRFNRLPAPLETAIFRIVQEGLTNALRHGRADRVAIRLVQQQEQRISIEIEDRGVGFDLDRVGGSCFGLEGIRQRARSFGGHAHVESRPGKGTRITAELPLDGGPPEAA